MSEPDFLLFSLRKFTTEFSYQSKLLAKKHAAFETYVSLYEGGLLNDNLLPFTSTIEGDTHEEVKLLLEEVEKRAGILKVPVQMDPWVTPDRPRWFCYEMVIGSLPPILMFIRQQIPHIADNEFPVLYVPGRTPIKTTLARRMDQGVSEAMIDKAAAYTEQLFTSLYGNRMRRGQTDYVYL